MNYWTRMKLPGHTLTEELNPGGGTTKQAEAEGERPQLDNNVASILSRAILEQNPKYDISPSRLTPPFDQQIS